MVSQLCLPYQEMSVVSEAIGKKEHLPPSPLLGRASRQEDSKQEPWSHRSSGSRG
jgi:hypothetical protein